MMQKLRLEAERRAEEEALCAARPEHLSPISPPYLPHLSPKALCAARPEAAPLLGRLAEVYATLREGAALSEAPIPYPHGTRIHLPPTPTPTVPEP